MTGVLPPDGTAAIPTEASGQRMSIVISQDQEQHVRAQAGRPGPDALANVVCACAYLALTFALLLLSLRRFLPVLPCRGCCGPTRSRAAAPEMPGMAASPGAVSVPAQRSMGPSGTAPRCTQSDPRSTSTGISQSGSLGRRPCPAARGATLCLSPKYSDGKRAARDASQTHTHTCTRTDSSQCRCGGSLARQSSERAPPRVRMREWGSCTLCRLALRLKS